MGIWELGNWVASPVHWRLEQKQRREEKLPRDNGTPASAPGAFRVRRPQRAVPEAGAPQESVPPAEHRTGPDQRMLKSGPLIKAELLTDIHQMS